MPEKPSDMNLTSQNCEDPLASALNQMTFQERNQAMEEVHGVDEIIQETPECVAKCLAQLEMELDQILVKPAYAQALQKNEGYVTNPKFRLMFLRADSFDTRMAAIRLVKFMETKLALFGPKALTRSIYYSDLDPDTIELIKSGGHQILPARTRSGKVVIVSTPPENPKPFETTESVFKSLFYLTTTHAETDEDSQIHGCVAVVYFPGSSMSQTILDMHSGMGEIDEVLPIRMTANHFCSQLGFFKPVKRSVIAAMVSSMRVRSRFHDGSLTEVKYSLMAFGIPVHVLPLGTSEVTGHSNIKWIAKQKVKDRVLQRTGQWSGIDLPGNNDVLFGRGRVFQDHSGNVQMREIVRSLLDEFSSGSSAQREATAKKAVARVRDLGGKFLNRDSNGWYDEVLENDVNDKIGTNFRTMLSSMNRVRQQEKQRQQQQQQQQPPVHIPTVKTPTGKRFREPL